MADRPVKNENQEDDQLQSGSSIYLKFNCESCESSNSLNSGISGRYAMACCSGGYATDRFKNSVDKNFLCPICADVLKDPVQCQNQHYFCKVCIKKHLEKNAKSCPICVQDLSEETLAEPPRILTDYLDGLMISCDHSEIGCTEVVQVSRLKTHVRECNYRPVVCTNEKCGQTFKQEDLADHVTNACEYRLVHCPDCEDDMIYKKFSKHACVLSNNLEKMELEWSEMKNVLVVLCNSQKEICDSQKEMCQLQNEMSNSQKEMSNSQKEMSNSQKELSDSQKEMSDSQKEMGDSQKEMSNLQKKVSHSQKEMCNSQKEMCNSQKEMRNSQKEILNSVQGLACNKQNIAMLSQAPPPNVRATVMVIGGQIENRLNSVEVLYPGSKTWTVLEPMQESHGSASSVLYGNDVIVCGGRSGEDIGDTVERLSLVNKPLRWVPFPVKLPLKCCGHKAVVINNCLYLVGGYDGENSYNTIYSILLHPPYTIELKCEMPQPISFHGLQAFEESLFIFGGSTSSSIVDVADTVLSYNTVNNEFTEMDPLLLASGDVATVRWNDNVIIIGGTARNGKSLNTAILYNVKENTHKMLPSMKHARSSCAATIAGNKVIVMGGYDQVENNFLNSVECFDLDR